MDDDRYARGMKALERVNGEDGKKAMESLKAFCPDMADHIIKFAYGDVASRPTLDARIRELLTVAALTAMGNARPQLKVHIEGALNAGCTREEVMEAIIQMAVYAGFPAAMNGIFAAKEVFDARKGK